MTTTVILGSMTKKVMAEIDAEPLEGKTVTIVRVIEKFLFTLAEASQMARRKVTLTRNLGTHRWKQKDYPWYDYEPA